jgi:hypothetical protein
VTPRPPYTDEIAFAIIVGFVVYVVLLALVAAHGGLDAVPAALRH